MTRSTLPGQRDLPHTGEQLAELARRKAAAPMRPTKPQQACDVGLFGDQAGQLDIIDRLR